MKYLLAGIVLALSFLAACSKNPDNAMTRYGENLVQSEKKAEDTANKANAVIAGQQKQMDQTADQTR